MRAAGTDFGLETTHAIFQYSVNHARIKILDGQILPRAVPPDTQARHETSVSAHPRGALNATFERADDPRAIERMWRALEARADTSFFQSAGWIGTWLRQLPGNVAPEALVVRDGERVVGLAVVCRANHNRHGFIRSHGLYLNETGNPSLDALTVEYNGLLLDRDYLAGARDAALDALMTMRPRWDELYLSGLVSADVTEYRPQLRTRGLGIHLRDLKRYDWVDLGQIREAGGDYIAGLSRNSRHQVRRARKLYEMRGPLTLTAARDLSEAHAFLDRLKELHQRYWSVRGEPGAFANPFFERFHRALISARFEAGETQLLRIASGQDEIGYLYNFVWRGRVYAYQSGFAYEADAKIKPGLVSHVLAVEHNLAEGAAVYDFMAGESQHKKSLGTMNDEMSWLVAQRPLLKYRAEHALRSVKQRLEQRRTRKKRTTRKEGAA